MDADDIPLVVPLVHTGMQEVMPVGAKFPKIGKTVTILVGDPINFDDIINEAANKNISRGKLYDAVSARIGDRLQKLKLQAEGLAIEQAVQLQNEPSLVTERAAGLLQNIDWESFGMENCVTVDNNSPRQQNLFVETNAAKLYPQESNPEDRCLSFGFSDGGGFVSRVRGCMDSTELMLFAARGLFTDHRTNEYFSRFEGVSPLKAWNYFWKSMSGNHTFLPNSVFTEAMQY